MRVLVCGGRDYHNWDFISRTLREFHKAHGISLLIHGNFEGADKLAAAWAWDRQIEVESYHPVAGAADMTTRNKIMISDSKPDHVIAFPGGEGTKNMVQQAEEAGITVTEY